MVKLKEPYLPILLLESNKISKQQNRISFRGNNHDLKVKSECGHQNYKQMSKIAAAADDYHVNQCGSRSGSSANNEIFLVKYKPLGYHKSLQCLNKPC